VADYTVSAGNGTLRPDEGADFITAGNDHGNLVLADGSAQEHQAINTYFKESAAVSTVKVLQIAQKATNSGGPGILFSIRTTIPEQTSANMTPNLEICYQ